MIERSSSAYNLASSPTQNQTYTYEHRVACLDTSREHDAGYDTSDKRYGEDIRYRKLERSGTVEFALRCRAEGVQESLERVEAISADVRDQEYRCSPDCGKLT